MNNAPRFVSYIVQDKDVLKVSVNRLYLSREQIFSSITHDVVESTEIDRFQRVSIFFSRNTFYIYVSLNLGSKLIFLLWKYN